MKHFLMLILKAFTLSFVISSANIFAADENKAEEHQDSAQKSMPAIEETIQLCESCHGADGNAPIDPSYPIIAGQYKDYLEQSLKDYREGKRTNILMAPQAMQLSDKEIKLLADFFSKKDSKLEVIQE